jgi:hypothetical protein
MTAVAEGLLVAACVFAGGMIGMSLHRLLPAHHLSKETVDIVRLGTGTMSVLAALVFGLLIASAKTNSDNADGAMRAYATDLIMLDRTLRAYGDGTEVLRALLQRSAARTLRDIWPGAGDRSQGLEDGAAREMLERTREAIQGLRPADAEHGWLQQQALQTATSLLRQRWILIEQEGPRVHPVVLAILVSWTVAIFMSFGLNAPRNATVIMAFVLCALSIGGAVFLILELDSPFEGILRISEQPVLRALAEMGEQS